MVNLATITNTEGSWQLLILVLEDRQLQKSKKGYDSLLFFDVEDPSQCGKAHCRLFIKEYNEALKVKKGDILLAQLYVRSLDSI